MQTGCLKQSGRFAAETQATNFDHIRRNLSMNREQHFRQKTIENNEIKYQKSLAEKAQRESLIRQAMAEEANHALYQQLKEKKLKRRV